MKKLITTEYVLPAYWASYLINGDASGLEDGEQKQIDDFLAREARANHADTNFTGCSEEPYFSRSCDCPGVLAGDMAEYTAILHPINPQLCLALNK